MVYGKKKKYHSYFQLSICDGSNVYVKNLHDYDIQISSINQIVTEFKLYQWQGIDKTIVPDVPHTKVFDTLVVKLKKDSILEKMIDTSIIITKMSEKIN